MRIHRLVASLACVAACARLPATRAELMAFKGGATLEVRNRSLDDLVLSLVRGGSLVRVGAVPALSSRVFALTGAQLGDGSELELSAGTWMNPHLRRSASFTVASNRWLCWVIDLHNQAGSVVVVR